MKQSRFMTVLALFAGVALGVAGSSTTHADDRAALPKAVQEAVKLAFPQGALLDADRERESYVVYEVKVKDGDAVVEVAVAGDGTILETERAVKRDELPTAVASALDRAAGGRKVGTIERGERRAKLAFVSLPQPRVVFEAKVQKANGRWQEVAFAEDGTLDDDDDDDGDDGDDGDDDDDGDDGDDDDGDDDDD